jgi:DNA-directed RNA polymerase subunit K/omega
LDAFGNLDSKFRFIILASKRAKQLLKGAKPKIQGKSKSLIRIAQAEVRNGLIDYEIIPTREDALPERDDRVFVGGGIPDEPVESEVLAGKDVVDEGVEVEPGEETEVDEEGDEEAEGEDDLAKDDKDE